MVSWHQLPRRLAVCLLARAAFVALLTAAIVSAAAASEAFISVEGNRRVDADAIKADYLEEVESFQAGYRADCIRARIDYVPLHTGMPFDKALMSYLLSRQARG